MAVWAVLLLGMPSVMHGCVFSLSLAAWIRNEEVYLNELRTNLCSFDLTPKPNVTLLWFSQTVTRTGDRRQASIAVAFLAYMCNRIKEVRHHRKRIMGKPKISIAHANGAITVPGGLDNSSLTADRWLAMFIAQITHLPKELRYRAVRLFVSLCGTFRDSISGKRAS